MSTDVSCVLCELAAGLCLPAPAASYLQLPHLLTGLPRDCDWCHYQ